MTTFTENNSRFRKLLPKVATRLMLGLSATLLFLPTGKALAGTPKMYSGSSILSVSYDECKTRSIKAAEAVLSEVKTPSETNGQSQIFGTTAATIAVIYCIERPGETASIITTSAYYIQNQSEALSVYQRLATYIKNGF